MNIIHSNFIRILFASLIASLSMISIFSGDIASFAGNETGVKGNAPQSGALHQKGGGLREAPQEKGVSHDLPTLDTLRRELAFRKNLEAGPSRQNLEAGSGRQNLEARSSNRDAFHDLPTLDTLRRELAFRQELEKIQSNK